MTTKKDFIQTQINLTLTIIFTALGLIAILFIIPYFYNEYEGIWSSYNITIGIIHIFVFIATVGSGIAAYTFGELYLKQKYELYS